MADKIRYLDGLRGIAAIIVVVHHFKLAFFPALALGSISLLNTDFGSALISAFPVSLLFAGNFAVCIFFVLSSYVLTFKYFQTQNQQVVVSGAVRRYLRLVIPILFVVLLAFTLISLHLYFNDLASEISISSWLRSPDHVALNLVDALQYGFLNVFLGDRPQLTSFYNNVLWTMSIEFIGSFLVFSFLMLFGNMRNRWVFYAGTGIALYNTYYLAFILGMLLSDLHNTGGTTKSVINNRLVVSGLFIVGLLLGSYESANWVSSSLVDMLSRAHIDSFMFFHVIGAFCILLSILNSKLLAQWLSEKMPVFLGKISFMVYLLHLLAIYSVSSLFFIAFNQVFSYDVALLLTFIITMAFTIAIAYIAYVYVDEPGTRLSRAIYEKYFTGSHSQPLISLHSLSRIVTFSQSNAKLLAIVWLILLLSTGAMVFVAAPMVDQHHADKLKLDYNQSLYSTEIAYQNVRSYPEFDGTSPVQYSEWISGYRQRADRLSQSYADLKYRACLIDPYLDLAGKQQVETNLSRYGAIVDESNINSAMYQQTYKEIYLDWYLRGKISSEYQLDFGKENYTPL